MLWGFSLALLFNLIFSTSLFGVETPTNFSNGGFKHFSVDEELKKRFSQSNTLVLKVHHHGGEAALFFVTFEDEESSDYWSRLNFKTTLFPGLNTLYFDLSQKIGQKGSEGERRINPKKLTKFYAIVDPDNEISKNFKVSLRSMTFRNSSTPKVPRGAWLFNFLGEDQAYEKLPGETLIYPRQAISEKGECGLSDIDLWRKESAEISPTRLSTSLGVTKATFKCKLPPGSYSYEIIWDHLGYWDTPFWSERRFKLNGKFVRVESRGLARDYLKDYLSLMAEPAHGAELFDFYLKKKFPPIKGAFSSDGKEVSFQFEGDASGVSLNSLFIYPTKIKKKAMTFLAQLEDFYRKEFYRAYRKVGPPQKNYTKLKAKAVSASSNMRSGGGCEKEASAKHVGARNYTGFIDVCVEIPNQSPVTYEIKGEFALESYQYRPKSVDLNHETFLIRADDIISVKHPSFEPNGYFKRYFRILPKKRLDPGEHKGKIVFDQDGQKTELGFSFHVLDAEYEKKTYRAGFLGLNPFPKTAHKGAGIQDSQNDYGLKALKALEEKGFSLFTDYPTPEVSYQGANRNQFSLTTKNFDQLASKVSSSELYFYNGEFPKALFTGHQRNAGQTEKSFWENMKEELTKLKASHAPKKFIYLFSDEATGYRNAVEEDIKLFKKYKKLFPGLKVGGFGDLHTWEKGKKLYQKWDYGMYSEVPSKELLKKVKSSGQEVGVYNLCAGPEENLFWCFGPQLYILQNAGVKRYFEWHASGVHNYPGFDLDGRESDIALFYPNEDGDLTKTRRFAKASAGMELALKLRLLEKKIEEGGLDASSSKIQKWLNKLKQLAPFPIKEFKHKYQDQAESVSNKADEFLLKAF